MDDEIVKDAQGLLDNIGLPTRPDVILEIQAEMAKEDVDFTIVSSIVKKDIAMSSMVVKTANSPLFAGGKIQSIEQALVTLGTTNFYNIILASALKKVLQSTDTGKEFFEYFWNHTEIVSNACAVIARELKIVPEGYAFMTGMFHDCAVPLLVKRFATYSKVFKIALSMGSSIVTIENEVYNTNHCIVGFMMARSWNLPDAVCKAIRYHHNPNIDTYDDTSVRKLACVLILAETISYAGTMKNHAVGNYELEPAWRNISEQYLSVGLELSHDPRWAKILVELGLDDGDVYNLQEVVFSQLSSE